MKSDAGFEESEGVDAAPVRSAASGALTARDAAALSGILLVDKPAGITSSKVVSIARKRLGLKRIGHAGTLDPLATGLLVLLVGNATRLASYAEGGTKEYEIEILLGRRTSSDDTEGEILSESPVLSTPEEVTAALAAFQGELTQIPPQVSAIKVDGERAYDRARRGETTELAARVVTVFSLTVLDVSLPRVRARIECSKGTYMRSIARDLGEQLGCGACISAIRRTRSAPFTVAEASIPDQISAEALLGWDRLLPRAQRCMVDGPTALQLRNGNTSVLTGFVGAGSVGGLRVPSAVGEELAIYYREESSQALGLLVFEDGRWTIGINIALGN
jgi:tRNA pseudouridine55 synthase